MSDPGRVSLSGPIKMRILYAVKGRVRMRWGDQLEFSDEARPGDFIYVPPCVPHQAINASPDQSLLCATSKKTPKAARHDPQYGLFA
jgi:uncharacterized RmlC-like cupin family protein